jgi:hypothetical protein
MKLLDRYLSAIRDLLPADDRNDIIAELSDNIRAQVEDQEAQLGRPLEEAELQALLKGIGIPLLVAGRYRKDHRTAAFGREWIGPELFPVYWFVLKINAGLTFLVCVVITAVRVATKSVHTFSEVSAAILTPLLIQFGIITLIFAVIDHHMRANPEEWYDPNASRRRLRVKGPPRVPRFESIVQLIFLAILFAAWRELAGSPRPLPGPHSSEIQLGPIWHRVYCPTAIVLVASMVQAIVNLVRPHWTQFRSAIRAATGIAWLLILSFALGAGHWVVASTPPPATPQLASRAL